MISSDQDLVKRSLSGDQEAFGDLVERYGGLVRGTVMEIVRRPQELEDLAQDAFCRAFEELPRLREPAKFGHWLGRIAANVALGWLRHERTIHAAAANPQLQIASSPMSPVEVAEEHERSKMLWQALDQLPVEYRRTLVLFYLEGCNQREMARFAGVSVATIKWRLYRGRASLRQELEQLLLQQREDRKASRRRLRQKVMAALPVAAALEREASAQTWPPPILDRIGSALIARPVLTVSLVGSLLIHVAGVSLFDWWPLGGRSRAAQTVGLGSGSTPQASRYSPIDTNEVLELELGPSGPETDARDLTDALLDADAELVPPMQPEAALYASGSDALAEPSLSGLGTAGSESVLTEKAKSGFGGYTPEEVAVRAAPRAPPGHVVLRPLRLTGAGSYTASGNFLGDLARYLRDHVGIEASVSAPREGFLSEVLLDCPMYFLFQGGGLQHDGVPHVMEWSLRELELLARYLRAGGFLYVEGGHRYLGEMIRNVREVLDSQGSLFEIPFTHDLYHSLHDYDRGFPGEFAAKGQARRSWTRHPAELGMRGGQYPTGLWGWELDGEIAVVFSDLALLSRWWPDPSPSDTTDVLADMEPKTHKLQAAANIVVYVLTRGGSG